MSLELRMELRPSWDCEHYCACGTRMSHVTDGPTACVGFDEDNSKCAACAERDGDPCPPNSVFWTRQGWHCVSCEWESEDWNRGNSRHQRLPREGEES